MKVTVLNPPTAGTLALGMTATVSFSHTAGPPVALLPSSAVVAGPTVWTLDLAAAKAVPHRVAIVEFRGDGRVAISGGVPDGAQVVTAGAALLDEQMPVTAWAGTVR